MPVAGRRRFVPGTCACAVVVTMAELTVNRTLVMCVCTCVVDACDIPVDMLAAVSRSDAMVLSSTLMPVGGSRLPSSSDSIAGWAAGKKCSCGRSWWIGCGGGVYSGSGSGCCVASGSDGR